MNRGFGPFPDPVDQRLDHLPVTQEVVGSNPIWIVAINLALFTY